MLKRSGKEVKDSKRKFSGKKIVSHKIRNKYEFVNNKRARKVYKEDVPISFEDELFKDFNN